MRRAFALPATALLTLLAGFVMASDQIPGAEQSTR